MKDPESRLPIIGNPDSFRSSLGRFSPASKSVLGLGLLFLAFILGPSFGLAAPALRMGAFQQLVHSAQQNCAQLNCDTTEITAISLEREQIKALPADLAAKLHFTANRLAEAIWPDTVLEGPYFWESEVKIIGLEEIQKNGQLLGWRIRYAGEAWDIDTCCFDYNDRSTLKSCQNGKIAESAFVSLDFSETFRDNANYARYFASPAPRVSNLN